jgi:integrase
MYCQPPQRQPVQCRTAEASHHASAIASIAMGVLIRKIQELMGHKDVKMYGEN